MLSGISKVDTNGSTCRERSSVTSSTVKSGAKVVATWNDGNGMVIAGFPQWPSAHRRQHLPGVERHYTTAAATSASDAAKLIAQSMIYVASPLRANPSPADFGEVAVLGSADLNVDFENQGSAPITIASGDITPTGVFTVDTVSFPKTLNPGDKLSLKFSAKPNAAGQLSAIYTLTPSTAGVAPGVVATDGEGHRTAL